MTNFPSRRQAVPSRVRFQQFSVQLPVQSEIYSLYSKKPIVTKFKTNFLVSGTSNVVEDFQMHAKF